MCILAQFFEKGLGKNHVFFDLSSNFGFWSHPKFSDVEKSLLLQKPQKELFVGPVTRPSRLEKRRDEMRRDRLDLVSSRDFVSRDRLEKKILSRTRKTGEKLKI